ncbi:hypothetical protein H2199_008016 [Coniosporium tulheliwenetii]|uniref:Uncharacterized protein n=1 Tax=Coniosporium tulheliwenetii TaxID=3383036 RepID=A0ACC2YLT7_9PEZI|nr:hypothetical protein H2199_008016 [Cladosporium sp. JES 115]
MASLITAYHVLINILSTIMLTASNYCMQLLSAPTRDEVARAHRHGQGLDIGIISLRNLRYISKRRTALWLSLALSSIPLHLLYNSAVFGVTIGQHYNLYYIGINDTDTIRELSATKAKVTNTEWWKKYSTRYVEDAADLYLIADRIGFQLDFHTNNTWSLAFPSGWSVEAFNPIDMWSILFPMEATLNDNGTFEVRPGPGPAAHVSYDLHNFPTSHFSGPIPWPQPRFINVSEISPSGLKNLVPSSPDENSKSFQEPWLQHLENGTERVDPPLHIKYGFSTPRRDSSKVQIALSFMLVVIACNAVKVVAMLLTLRESFSSQLLTSGDAVASFLALPEHDTLGMCTFGKAAMRSTRSERPEPGVWEVIKCRLSTTAGRDRMGSVAFLISMCTVAIALAFVAIRCALQEPSGLWSWGTVSSLRLNFTPQSFTTRGILINSFLANTPQIILSGSYFAINRLCTSMCFTKEWNSYAKSRKGLRVTNPRGEQRSTYFLQLPFRWAVPLTIMSGTLHWLLSQSIFLVRLEIRDEHGQFTPSESKSACGYSALSTLTFALVAVGLVSTTLLLWRRKIKVGIPVAAHCSLAISAACHSPPDEEEPHLKPVQWGVVRNRFGGEVDHCTYSSEPVTAPEPGKRYA